LEAVSLVVHLPEELSRRVEAVAAERGVSAEQVAVEAIEERVGTPEAPRRAPNFIGIGSSGAGEAIGRRHREIIREHFADKTARDV
jgi:predicted transcriptional regulator